MKPSINRSNRAVPINWTTIYVVVAMPVLPTAMPDQAWGPRHDQVDGSVMLCVIL